MLSGVDPVAAVVGGLLSFLSPCVLAVVPAYIAYLGGAGVEAAGHGDAARTEAPHLTTSTNCTSRSRRSSNRSSTSGYNSKTAASNSTPPVRPTANS